MILLFQFSQNMSFVPIQWDLVYSYVGFKYSFALHSQCGSSLAQVPLHFVLLQLLQLRFCEDSHVAQRHKR